MDCRGVQDQLIEFCEDQLARGEAEQISAHLEMCSRCREELRAIEKVIGGLKSLRVPEPDEAFWQDFPKRVGKTFDERKRAVRAPFLLRAWEGIYRGTRWFPLPKAVGVAVSVTAIVLVIAGLLLFKAGWFWTGSREIGEEALEEYFGGMGVVVSPFAPGLLETISLDQLNDISNELGGWLHGMGNWGEEDIERDGFLHQEDVFTQLEGLSSRELDFVYDALKEIYLQTPNALSMPTG